MFPPGGGPAGGDPFAMLGAMMSNMDRMMNQAFQDPFFGMPQPPNPYHQQQQQHPNMYNLHQYPQQQAQTAPRVEEVPAEAGRHAGSSSAPIVEEPDEDGHAAAQPQHNHSTQPRAQPQHTSTHSQQQQYPAPLQDPFGGMQLMNPFGGGAFGGGLFGNMLGGMAAGGPGAGQVYSYSSSTVVRSGPDGTYHSSTTSRQAPGGVRETQRTVRDGRVGMESMTIARGMGDQERVVTRTRDPTGQIRTEEHHAGIDPSSAQEFDQQWTQRAQQTMPSWMQQQQQQGRTQRIAPGGRQQQQQLALPPAASSTQHDPRFQAQQQQGYHQQGASAGYGQQQQQPHGPGGNGRGVGGNGGWPGGYHV